MKSTDRPSGAPRMTAASIAISGVLLSAGSALFGAYVALRLSDESPPETAATIAAPPTDAPTPTPPPTAATTTTIDPDLPVIHEIADEDAWYAAVRLAKPGDTLHLVATISSRLEYRGGQHDGIAIAASGTEVAPIRITAAPDVWIDPGDMSNNTAALDLREVDFVVVDGVNVRNSQFGIRLVNVSGSDLTPAAVMDSTVTDIGHSAIAVQADFNTLEPSSHVLIKGNTVTDTGLTNPRFGEGVYIGSGSTEIVYQDETHDITVSDNRISSVGAEAIDVKPGTRDIVIEDNDIFDVAPIDGGAISAHYASDPNPKPQELDLVVIRNNRIWNQNLNAVPGSNDWAIWVGHGGVTIENNRIWGLRDGPDTRAIRVRALADFGPHPIVVRGNTFWTTTGVVAEGEPSGAPNLLAEENIGPSESMGTIAVDPSYFASPVPPVGSGGDADAGAGPGSAFEPA